MKSIRIKRVNGKLISLGNSQMMFSENVTPTFMEYGRTLSFSLTKSNSSFSIRGNEMFISYFDHCAK